MAVIAINNLDILLSLLEIFWPKLLTFYFSYYEDHINGLKIWFRKRVLLANKL